MCGEHLAAGALPLLDAIGVGAQVRSAGVSIKRVALLASPQHRLTIPAGANEAELPKAFSRYRFDHLLVEHAQRLGVDLYSGRRVRSVLSKDGIVCGVETKNPARTDSAEVFRAPVVVAADGRQSIVVRETGFAARRGPALVGFKRHFPFPSADADIHADELAMFGLPGGYLGVAPVEDGSLNLCGLLPSQAFVGKSGPLDAVIENRLSIYPSLRRLIAHHANTEPWTTIADVRTQSSRPRMRGVLYIGDAFGTIEPMTGQGMTMALAGAHLAYQELNRPDAGEGVEAATQRRFEAAWNAMFRGSIRRASALAMLLRRPRVMQGLMLADRLPMTPITELFGRLYRSLPVGRTRYEELASHSLRSCSSAQR